MGPTSGGKKSVPKSQKGLKNGPKKIIGMKAISTRSRTHANALVQNMNSDIQIPISNSFNIGDKTLSDYDETDDEMSVNSSQNIANRNPVKGTEMKKNTIPPIIIAGQNVSAIQDLCKNVIVSMKYEVKLLGIGIRVQIQQRTEFDEFCKTLVDKSISHYKYHTSETRPRKIVLSGLHEMDIADLKAILAENKVHPEDIKSFRLHKNHYQYDNQSVYLLYFKPGTVKLPELRNIKHINNIIVKWAPYSPRTYNKYAQCRNCQMHGHSSINCHMTSRCAVCAQEHKTEDCKKKIPRAVLEHKRHQNEEIDKSFVKCANCKENHPATFHGCDARKNFIKIQQKYQKPTKTRHQTPRFQYRETEFPEIGTQPRRETQQRQSSFSHVVQQPQQQQYDNSMQQFMMSMMSTFSTLIDKLSTMIEQFSRILSRNQP